MVDSISPGEAVGIWIAGILSLMIFSFIYRDNPVFKVAEHIFLGISLGYSWCLYYFSSIYPQAIKPLHWTTPAAERDYWVIIPIILGLFILLRMVPSLGWLSRISFAVYVGGFAGIAIPSVIAANLLPQITATMQPITFEVGMRGEAINQILLIIGVFSTLLFFFFSLEHKGTAGHISRVGIVFIMLCFGASFGYTVMGRVSLLIGRFQFIIDDWIKGVMLGMG